MAETSEGLQASNKEINPKNKLFFLKEPIQINEAQRKAILPLFVDEDDDEYSKRHLERNLTNVMQGTLRIIDRCQEDEINTVFFLDKSARPLATLMRSTWKKLLPEIPLPQVRFIDIGRTQEEADNSGLREPKRIDDEDAQKLSERYSQVDAEGKILVIDEFSWGGNTIEQAKMTLRQMYPQAAVTGELALDSPHPWYGKPELLAIDEGPNGTEAAKDKTIARYFASPSTTDREPRKSFQKQLETISDVITSNVETVSKGSRRVSKVHYPRNPWD